MLFNSGPLISPLPLFALLSQNGFGRSISRPPSRDMMESPSSLHSHLPPLASLHGNNCMLLLLLALSTHSSPSFSAVLLVDIPRNALVFLSTDGFTSHTLSLDGDSPLTAMLWPRSIFVTHTGGGGGEEEKELAVTISLGEMFGKIWRVGLNLSLLSERETRRAKGDGVPLPPLSESLSSSPSLVLDWSDFDASISVRGLRAKTRVGMSRDKLIYPDLLD
jgi:hypothetical protein